MLCWIKVVRVGILVLFLILEEMVSAFHQSMTLAVCLSYVTFIMLKYVLSVPTFWKVFIMNGY